MTTKGIENQYEAYDDVLNDISRVCEKLANAINNEDIHIAIAAMCTIIIDSTHQLDMPEEDRATLIRTAMAAAWKDFHSTPPIEEQH